MTESWKIINQVLNKRPKSTTINNLCTSDGVIVNKQKIAHKMNEYFWSVGKDLAEKIAYALNPLLSGDYNVNPEEKCFRFKLIDVLSEMQLAKLKHLNALKTLLPTSLTHHSKVGNVLMIGKLQG